jgi:hypothetical protein
MRHQAQARNPSYRITTQIMRTITDRTNNDDILALNSAGV